MCKYPIPRVIMTTAIGYLHITNIIIWGNYYKDFQNKPSPRYSYVNKKSPNAFYLRRKSLIYSYKYNLHKILNPLWGRRSFQWSQFKQLRFNKYQAACI